MAVPYRQVLLPAKFAANMYVLKIKGKARIPDYVQVRDNNFTLIAYFRLDRPEKAIAKLGLSLKKGEIITQLNSMPYGKVIKTDW